MRVSFNMKIWFRNQLIKNKVIAMYIPLVVIPLFLLGAISNYIFTQSIIDRTVKNILDDSKLISTRIDSILASTESCANITAVNLSKTIEGIDLEGGNESLRPRFVIQLRNLLSFSLSEFRDVESIIFIDKDGDILSPNEDLISGLAEAYPIFDTCRKQKSCKALIFKTLQDLLLF